jgi:hypothetical protein
MGQLRPPAPADDRAGGHRSVSSTAAIGSRFGTLTMVRRLLVLPAVFSGSLLATVVLPDPTSLALSPEVRLSTAGHGPVVLAAVSIFGLLAALAVVLADGALGPAVAFTTGPWACALALPLTRDVAGPWQYATAFALAATGSGALLAAGLSLLATAHGRLRWALLACWLVPLTAFAADSARAEWAPRGTLDTVPVLGRPAPLAIGVACGICVCWGVLSLWSRGQTPHILDPRLAGYGPTLGWLAASVLTPVALGVVLLSALGHVSLPWLRALIVVVSAIVVATLAAPAWTLRRSPLVLAYVSLLALTLVVCPVMSVALGRVVVQAGTRELPAYVVTIVGVATLVGCVAGWRRAGEATVLRGLAGVGLGLAGTLVMSGHWWWPTLCSAALVFFGAASLAASLPAVFAAGLGPALVVGGLVGMNWLLIGKALVLGLSGWALGGDVPSSAADLVSTGRIAAGLSYVAVVAMVTFVAAISDTSSDLSDSRAATTD